jgi:hypothetical protein
MYLFLLLFIFFHWIFGEIFWQDMHIAWFAQSRVLWNYLMGKWHRANELMWKPAWTGKQTNRRRITRKDSPAPSPVMKGDRGRSQDNSCFVLYTEEFPVLCIRERNKELPISTISVFNLVFVCSIDIERFLNNVQCFSPLPFPHPKSCHLVLGAIYLIQVMPSSRSTPFVPK